MNELWRKKERNHRWWLMKNTVSVVLYLHLPFSRSALSLVSLRVLLIEEKIKFFLHDNIVTVEKSFGFVLILFFLFFTETLCVLYSMFCFSLLLFRCVQWWGGFSQGKICSKKKKSEIFSDSKIEFYRKFVYSVWG